MGKMKELLIDVVEMAEKEEDYQKVADYFGMSVAEVVSIVRQYGEKSPGQLEGVL
jgi:hypothetical protein